jgi:hypothetical protein
MEVEVTPKEVKEGDCLVGKHGWVAQSDAQETENMYEVLVQYADGGLGVRSWGKTQRATFKVER